MIISQHTHTRTHTHTYIYVCVCVCVCLCVCVYGNLIKNIRFFLFCCYFPWSIKFFYRFYRHISYFIYIKMIVTTSSSYNTLSSWQVLPMSASLFIRKVHRYLHYHRSKNIFLILYKVYSKSIVFEAVFTKTRIKIEWNINFPQNSYLGI